MKLTNAALITACLTIVNAKNLLESPKATIQEYDKTDAPLTAEVPKATINPVIEAEPVEAEEVAEIVAEPAKSEPKKVEDVPKEPTKAPEHVPTKEEREAAAEAARIKAQEEAEAAAKAKAEAEEEAYRALVALRWEHVDNMNYYSRQIWLGMFQGFYGMNMKAVKPTDDCFGGWVPESAHELVNFGWDLRYNFWNVTYKETETAAYDVVDLLFRNDEYCHFRQTFWDMYEFCHTGENCQDVWGNL